MPAGLYRDGAEYYGSIHFHPKSQSRYTAMSLMDFDAEEQNRESFLAFVRDKPGKRLLCLHQRRFAEKSNEDGSCDKKGIAGSGRRG